MNNPTILVQAASRAWSGAPDWCMNEIDGRPVVALTIESGLKHFPDASVRIIAPEFDKGGRLDDIPAMFPDNEVDVFYGSDDSPLERMIGVMENKPDDSLFIRVDGLHFAWLPEHASIMLKKATKENLDCVKMPDDFPVQLTADVYKLGALKKASTMLKEHTNGSTYEVHPKFFMLKKSADFNCAHLEDYPEVDDEWLKTNRIKSQGVYIDGRMHADRKKAIEAGDQLTLHYELALDYVSPDSVVLDCACGPGYGSRMLARKASKVIAADLDLETVRNAAAGKYYSNLTFQTGNATGLSFPENSFDMITSFETVEHVEPEEYLKEMHRLLKPGGLLLLSTPQNSLGHIPVNSQHIREYSLEEIMGLCNGLFEIEKTIGIKQGRIIFPDDPKGQNTFMVCKKST